MARAADDNVERMEFLLNLRRSGIMDANVLRAMDEVPREYFVPPQHATSAYADHALPIACGQTISQPYIVAFMSERLDVKPQHRVLEIGTGSGYQTVLLSHLSAQVFSIERVGGLLERARDAIRESGARNVSLLAGDGTLGWREYGPFDAILVTAGAPQEPPPLVEQLAEGGRMLIPIGEREEQRLTLVTRHGDALDRRDMGPARFVPLVGMHGWPS